MEIKKEHHINVWCFFLRIQLDKIYNLNKIIQFNKKGGQLLLLMAIQLRSLDRSMQVHLRLLDGRSLCICSRIPLHRIILRIHVQILLGCRTVSYFLRIIQHRTIFHKFWNRILSQLLRQILFLLLHVLIFPVETVSGNVIHEVRLLFT